MSKNNLIDEEAVSKLQELVKKSNTCMFATNLTELPIHICPMRVQEVDYDGNLWFFSNRQSTHNKQINADARVQAVFTNTPDMEFLTVFGSAEIDTDQARIDRLWNPMVAAWFEGKDDPNICLLKLQPVSARYWDTESGKFTTMAKIITRAITGSDISVGVAGKLEV